MFGETTKHDTKTAGHRGNLLNFTQQDHHQVKVKPCRLHEDGSLKPFKQKTDTVPTKKDIYTTTGTFLFQLSW